MSEHAAFYLPVGEDEFESTPATSSPWDFSMQHGGPPSALLARAIERCAAAETMGIARMTVDFLAGIPQGRIRTEAKVLRDGRRIQLLEANLWANGKLAVRASAWRIRQHEGLTAQFANAAPELPPLPAPTPARYFDGIGDEWGYGQAIEWRFVEGGLHETGPARVWTRVKIPLVDGEETSPVERMLIVADSTNGLSGEMPITEWLFIPPTLTVTIQRVANSDWILLDAATTISSSGTGIANGTMFDHDGLLCRIAQPLLIAPQR